MPRRLLTLSIAVFATALHCGWTHATAVPWINCSYPHQRESDLTPLGPGPLELTKVHCQLIRQGLLSAPLISPDGRSIAYFDQTGGGVLYSAPLDVEKDWTRYQVQLGVSPRNFKWDSNSSNLWTATRETMQPSGWSKTQLQPVIAVKDGSLQPLPELRHESGTLDGLFWVNDDGLAVAQFGTSGGLYRPEQANPTPTFAIVDAKHGLVLDALPFDVIETLKGRKGAPYGFVNYITATKLQTGKVRALISVGQWIVWTRGEKPRVLPDPYAGEPHGTMKISPDGTKVLVGRPLSPIGKCGRTGGCTFGPPVEGVIAALHDLNTGQIIWSIRATVKGAYPYPTPAISGDGRYALVGLYPEDNRARIALVSMSDGKIIQILPHAFTMGFVRDRQTVWTHRHGVTAFYDFHARAQ